ncbi:hypothetical protein [cf. Phormidesmis sp. LEGE 11477]|uniref:hypothetical protein n=1 Tax=cf. Phormidesmis sp. LEGE 11477 TaxID=1828680 RepID=UPI00187F24AE|nr:hypothetical protein [cf. Phormidesmis sp. LEGE 11477]MBE9061752.1 hypothetical protein [cf. Phormidesmis sp. LEGE 11477]
MSVWKEDKPDKSTAFNAAQQALYDDLLESARNRPPVESLADFEALFFGHSSLFESEVSPFLYHILFANDESEFRNTLKRACYILINNWERRSQGDMVQALLALFHQPSLHKPTLSPSMKRLRHWLLNFADSQDFEELKIFAIQRINLANAGNWSNRYVVYRLVTQAIDDRNSFEQKDAAKKMASKLKNKFKHDLALYTAFSHGSSQSGSKYPNPTVLGDEVLRLVKSVLLRRDQFSYRNVARIFQQQLIDTSYQDYKESLVDYLCFSIAQPEFVAAIETTLPQQLAQLYPDKNEVDVNSSLALRTCNRLIDWITTEDNRRPTPLFEKLLAQGNPLNIAVLILKIVLISPNSQLYLEARLASLVNYYEPYLETECTGVIQFLEICNVMFAIYSDSVEYSLVRVNPRQEQKTTPARNQLGQSELDLNQQTHHQSRYEPESLEDFRIFSRSLRAAQKKASRTFQQHRTERTSNESA